MKRNDFGQRMLRQEDSEMKITSVKEPLSGTEKEDCGNKENDKNVYISDLSDLRQKNRRLCKNEDTCESSTLMESALQTIQSDYEMDNSMVYMSDMNGIATTGSADQKTISEQSETSKINICRPKKKAAINAVFIPQKTQSQHGSTESKKIKEHSDPRDISLYCLEKKLKASGVILDFVFGRFSYFNGRNYVAMSEKTFCALCKEKLDKDILSRIMQMRTLKDLYEYATLCSKEREKTEIQENFLVSFTNGVLDLRSLQFFGHSPEHKVSFTVDADCILAGSLEAAYESFSSTVTCNFLNQMVDGDQESIRLVMQMIGFLLLNVVPKRAFFWLGPAPASGKSVLMELIRRLLGSDVVCHIDAHRMGEKFSLAQLLQSRVNLGLDSSGKLSSADVSAIKTLSGDPVMSIERKFREREDYLNYTKLVFASNESADICESDVSDAVWDRLKLIYCSKSCDEHERDPFLIDKLMEERDLLMEVVVQETHALIQGNFRFAEPKISKKIKYQWRYANENPVATFIRERLVISDCEGTFISTNTLFQEFVQYTGSEMMACNVFSNLLSRYSPKPLISKKGKDESGHRVRGFANVQFRDDEERD